VNAYLRLLTNRNFSLLWVGVTVSTLGDGLTFTSLIWLVYSMTKSTSALGLLVALYTAPVVVGGLVAGSILDRWDRRKALVVDNVVRGVFVASIPLLFHFGLLRLWNLYLVAGVYGFLFMISLAGIPSVIPSLVSGGDLNTANAMESISYGVGGVAGPALAGALIGLIGGANVVAIDAVSYFVFVACLSGLLLCLVTILLRRLRELACELHSSS
jgi:MFS family permease